MEGFSKELLSLATSFLEVVDKTEYLSPLDIKVVMGNKLTGEIEEFPVLKELIVYSLTKAEEEYKEKHKEQDEDDDNLLYFSTLVDQVIEKDLAKESHRTQKQEHKCSCGCSIENKNRTYMQELADLII